MLFLSEEKQVNESVYVIEECLTLLLTIVFFRKLGENIHTFDDSSQEDLLLQSILFYISLS